MTLSDWLTQAEAKLKRVEINSARLDSHVLAGSVLNKDRAWLAAHRGFRLSKHQLGELNGKLKLRLNRQPLAYITGAREFYGLDFKVTPDVLIPRPETENMVEEAAKIAPEGGQVLEVGTGSGCIAITLKQQRPDLDITASDISANALKIAKTNAGIHRADISFVLSDLFDSVQGRYDVVLANLPYVPDGTRRMAELDFEPALALFGGADGLDYYRQFLPELRAHLTEVGVAIIEAGPSQRRTLKLLAKNAGFKLTSLSEYISLLK